MEVDQASGVRGLLGKPYEFISREDSLSLDEEEYRRLFTPVVNNYIHVTDSLAETAQAIAMIGMGVELREAYHIAGMGVDGN
jgi:hypothetical protein